MLRGPAIAGPYRSKFSGLFSGNTVQLFDVDSNAAITQITFSLDANNLIAGTKLVVIGYKQNALGSFNAGVGATSRSLISLSVDQSEPGPVSVRRRAVPHGGGLERLVEVRLRH